MFDISLDLVRAAALTEDECRGLRSANAMMLLRQHLEAAEQARQSLDRKRYAECMTAIVGIALWSARSVRS